MLAARSATRSPTRWSAPKTPKASSAACASWLKADPRREQHERKQVMPIPKDVLRQKLTKSGSEFLDLFTARYPLLYVVSPEEARVEEEMRQIALAREIKLVAWSITRGFVQLCGTHKGGDVKDPIK